ncbi:MAG: SDR family oxidoreductase [Bdellovibrio sp.]
MELSLKNKKALVFGSSQGIGLSIAETLIKEGAKVVINSRNADKISKVASSIGASGFVAADLSQPGSALKATQEAINKLGGIDIIVFNTGGPKKGLFHEITTEQWREDFQNLWISTVESLEVALPKMKEQKFGRILFITSIAAKEPLPALTTSNGLRAGLEGLSKSLCHEVASFNITSNIIKPGYTNTDRLKELKLSDEKVKQMVPAGRLGEPEELAALAAFLCSPLAGYITGQSIAIDGGVSRAH